MDNMFSEKGEVRLPVSIHKGRETSIETYLRSILSQKSKYNFQVLMHLV